MRDLFLFCAFFFTSGTCWGLFCSLLRNAFILCSLIWSGLGSLHLLDACLWDCLVLGIFSNLFPCRAQFCLFLLSLFLLLLVIYSFTQVILFCSLCNIFAIVLLLFVVLHTSSVDVLCWLIVMNYIFYHWGAVE